MRKHFLIRRRWQSVSRIIAEPKFEIYLYCVPALPSHRLALPCLLSYIFITVLLFNFRIFIALVPFDTKMKWCGKEICEATCDLRSDSDSKHSTVEKRGRTSATRPVMGVMEGGEPARADQKQKVSVSGFFFNGAGGFKGKHTNFFHTKIQGFWRRKNLRKNLKKKIFDFFFTPGV